MISVETNMLLTRRHEERLKKTVKDIRNEREEKGDEWDVDSIVEEAFTRIFGNDIKNIKYEIILPDIEIEF